MTIPSLALFISQSLSTACLRDLLCLAGVNAQGRAILERKAHAAIRDLPGEVPTLDKSHRYGVDVPSTSLDCSSRFKAVSFVCSPWRPDILYIYQNVDPQTAKKFCKMLKILVPSGWSVQIESFEPDKGSIIWYINIIFRIILCLERAFRFL